MVYDSQMRYSDIYATMTLVAEHTHAHQDRHRHRRSQQSDRAGRSAFYRDHQPTCTGARDARGWNRIHRPQHDGLSPVRLDDLREHVRICRALLCGGEVLFREGIGKPVPLSC
jgi:hypothetical protein